MFLSDHETATDLLYYEVISNAVVELIRDVSKRPMSLGIHGDWGAGKSSVLAMVENALKTEENVICVWFNGWQFQGYEDAKTVLMERILAVLEENKTIISKAKDELVTLAKRVRWLKVARKVAGLVITAKTGIPVELLANGDKIDDYFKAPEDKTVPKEIDAFQKEFENLLRKAGIERLVVLLDDLDRCLPNTAIETLEAIKLFLFVPRAVFVIAADEAMIEYAVRRHFPDLPPGTGPLTYTRSYLEKLIQVPFRIPAMGGAETRVYIALLYLEACTSSNSNEFNTLRQAGRDVLRKPWESKLFDRERLRAQFPEAKLPDTVENALTLSDQLAPILSEQSKGNPRQVKRFLNALLLRETIAKARGFGAEIKTQILAKIMLVERFFEKFYDALAAEVAASTDGKVELFKDWEQSGEKRHPQKQKTQKESQLAELADNEEIQSWVRSGPSLSEVDLRPYILITRDRRSLFSAAIVEHQNLLERLLGNKLVVAGASQELRAVPPNVAVALFDEVTRRIKLKEEYADLPDGAVGLTEIVKTHPHLQQRLVDFLSQLPTSRLGPWILGESGWDTALKEPALRSKWKEQVRAWSEQKGNRRLQKTAQAILPTIK